MDSSCPEAKHKFYRELSRILRKMVVTATVNAQLGQLAETDNEDCLAQVCSDHRQFLVNTSFAINSTCSPGVPTLCLQIVGLRPTTLPWAIKRVDQLRVFHHSGLRLWIQIILWSELAFVCVQSVVTPAKTNHSSGTAGSR